MAGELHAKYGDRVAIEYVDTSRMESRQLYQQVLAVASQYEMEFPLVAIDCRLRTCGAINTDIIYEALEEKLNRAGSGEKGE